MILSLEKVTAVDAEGPRRRPRGRITAVDLFLVPGVHAVLGSPEDGTLALVEAISGARRPVRGRVLVGEREPSSSAAVRARIGAMGPSPRLPDARTVEASVALAQRARGQAPAAASLLERSGLAMLARRAPEGLSFAEARAVERALCLSTPSPLLVVLHEPLADVASPDGGAVRQRLAEIAAAGACVVVTTSSPADARALGDQILVLQRGAVVRSVGGDGAGLSPGCVVPLIVWAQTSSTGAGVRDLAAALSARPEVQSLAFEGASGPGGLGALRIHGADVDACALALAEVAAMTGVVITAIATAPPALAEVQSWRLAPVPWVGMDLRAAHRPVLQPPARVAAPEAALPPPAADAGGGEVR